MAKDHPDWQATPKDRLSTAVFIAIALHGVILLGVGFHSALGSSADVASMEVILVRDPNVAPTANEQANYLANINQLGAGTGVDVRHAEAPSSSQTTGAAGKASGGSDHLAGDADNDLVATRSKSAPSAATQAIAAGERSPLVVEAPRSDTGSVDTGDGFALRGQPKKELVVTANTRESSVAVYLDAWRHRIERIGTANYPLDQVRKGRLTGNPVLAVRIAADGRLVDAVVSRSSGHVELDQAALNILRMAAPFEPFPRPLASLHDSVRLTYEWQFSNGELTDSSVRAPSDTR